MLLLKQRLLERKNSCPGFQVAKRKPDPKPDVISLDSDSDTEEETLDLRDLDHTDIESSIIRKKSFNHTPPLKQPQNLEPIQSLNTDNIVVTPSTQETTINTNIKTHTEYQPITKSQISDDIWDGGFIVCDMDYNESGSSDSDNEEDQIDFHRRKKCASPNCQDRHSSKIRKPVIRKTPMISSSVSISLRTLNTRRVETKKKFSTIWQCIIDKYSRYDEKDQGDIVNLEDFSIEENKGHIKKLKKIDRSDIWSEFDATTSEKGIGGRRQPMYENLEKLDMYDGSYEFDQYGPMSTNASNNDPICLLTPKIKRTHSSGFETSNKNNCIHNLKSNSLLKTKTRFGVDPITLITPPKSAKKSLLQLDSITPPSGTNSVFSSGITSKSNSVISVSDTEDYSGTVDPDNPFLTAAAPITEKIDYGLTNFIKSRNISSYNINSIARKVSDMEEFRNDPINVLTPTRLNHTGKY